jgi:hypothetical protein
MAKIWQFIIPKKQGAHKSLLIQEHTSDAFDKEDDESSSLSDRGRSSNRKKKFNAKRFFLGKSKSGGADDDGYGKLLHDSLTCHRSICKCRIATV